jgi:hypothetical protein
MFSKRRHRLEHGPARHLPGGQRVRSSSRLSGESPGARSGGGGHGAEIGHCPLQHGVGPHTSPSAAQLEGPGFPTCWCIVKSRSAHIWKQVSVHTVIVHGDSPALEEAG